MGSKIRNFFFLGLNYIWNFFIEMFYMFFIFYSFYIIYYLVIIYVVFSFLFEGRDVRLFVSFRIVFMALGMEDRGIFVGFCSFCRLLV